MTLNDFTPEDRPHVYVRVNILNAIIHNELKNYSLVLSIGKQIIKNNGEQLTLIAVEEKILKALMVIAAEKHLTIKKESAIFQDLSESINETKTQNNLIGNSLKDNYYKWVQAKLKRKLVSEIFK